MVTSFICIHTKVCVYSIKETICNRAKSGSELPESVAPILRNGGSQSPDRRLNEPRNNHELVFDTNCEIIAQYSHIFSDPENFLRIPESVRESSNKILLFDGAIKRAKQMINANYKTAVPQYYKGKIQLLIPICLINENIPDLALVVSKNEAGIQYLGHTCLTLDMAYNNARLIARPDSIWLKP